MLLRVLSDAFFLSRPKAGSVAGRLSYLGLIDDDDWFNYPISCHSTRIPVVVYSFVAEADYAALPASRQRNAKSWPIWATPNLSLRCFATTRWPLASRPTRSPSERPPTCACTGSGIGSATCPIHPRSAQRGGLLHEAYSRYLSSRPGPFHRRRPYRRRLYDS